MGWLRDAGLGALAGIAGGAAMNLFARAASDRRGHGVQAPQARQGPGGVDATERVGEIGFALATGSDPDRVQRQRLGTAAHYAFSGLLGAVYALAPVSAHVHAGRGLAFGTAVWVLADEGLIPALALSRGPRQLPAAVHAYAWLGHCVYGVAVDTAIRLLNPPLSNSRTPAYGTTDRA